MSLDNPILVNYKPFYIQNATTCFNVEEEWGFITKTNPYPALPTPKTPYKNDWKDRSGDDEFTTRMYYESFEVSVQFYSRTKGQNAALEMRQSLGDFFNFIKEGDLMIYDAYTGLGRQKVRYAGFSEDMFRSRGTGTDTKVTCIFTIKFKVNDPVTFVSYNSSTGHIQ